MTSAIEGGYQSSNPSEPARLTAGNVMVRASGLNCVFDSLWDRRPHLFVSNGCKEYAKCGCTKFQCHGRLQD